MNKKGHGAIAAGLLVLATGASGQSSYVRPAYAFPADPLKGETAGIRIGDTPLYAMPYIGVAAGHDDNLFLRSDNEKSSALYITSPGVRLDARDANKVFQLAYQSQIGVYAQSDDDNYVDHTLKADFDVAFDRRNFLRLGVDYLRSHEPRGSTDRPQANRPDRYRLVSPRATYAFGTPGAIGRIEGYYSEGNKRYLNNREFTESSDRKTREFGGVFYMRLAPKTHALVEARRTNVDYDLSTSPLSADENRYYFGVSWDVTAATSGTFKIGRLERKFDTGLPKFSGTSWEGQVTWLPRTYSRFELYTARQTNESTGLGSFILSSIGGVTWTHAWSSFWLTAVDARYQKDQYQGFNRKDETTSLGLKVGYKFRRWLTLGAEYTHTQRDSNLSPFDYDRNLYLLTATASM